MQTMKALQVLDNEARQVKHTMHYLGSLYCFLPHGCIGLPCFVCLYWFFFFALKAFVLPSERRDLRFAFAIAHGSCACRWRLSFFLLLRPPSPLTHSFPPLYLHCADCGHTVHAKLSECAAMIMVQGRVCQPERWELVVFKRCCTVSPLAAFKC